MERDYTVGAMLTLVAIFVIALVVYFTVPGFNTAIKEIADDVFRLPKKGVEQQEEERAKKVFKTLVEGYEESYNGAVGCTYGAEAGSFSDKSTIKLEEIKGEKVLRLHQGKLILESEKLTNIIPCIMITDKTKADTPSLIIKYDDGIRIIHEGKKYKLLGNAFKFYKFDENRICLVTDKVKNKAFFNTKKDCKTGKNEVENKAKEKFQNFIQLYKKCKEHGGTEKCKCAEIDFEEFPEPYNVKVLQKGMETTFFLEKTNEKETIKDNKIAKVIKWFLSVNKLFGKEIEEYKEKERIEEKQKIVYYGDKRNIYLSKASAVAGLPLCIRGVNEYLRFNRNIPKEDYKKKLVAFTPKVEPYFEALYSAAKTYGVDLYMVAAVIQQESNWDPKIVSIAGAAGLMQLMPDAARDMGLNVPDYQKVKIRNGKTLKTYSCRKGLEEKYCKFKTDERFNAEKNIDAGVKYIKWLINGLNRNKKLDPVFENILASYNAGLGNVKKYEGVPPFKETMNYVKKTCGYYEQLNAKVCYA